VAGKRVDVILKFTIKFHDGLLGPEPEVERMIRNLLTYELQRLYPANVEDICIYNSAADFLADHLLDGLAGA
jgi:hypothetical protein